MNGVAGTPDVATTINAPEAAEATPDSTPRPQGPLPRFLVAAVRAYQLARIGRVSPCRFTPTCSQYAVEALSRHGARKGSRRSRPDASAVAGRGARTASIPSLNIPSRE